MTRRPRWLLAAVMMFALLLGQAHGAGAAPAPANPAVEARFSSVAEYCADSEEIAFLGLINDYRAQNNLAPLALSQKLSASSDHHSIDMATNEYFSHTLFDGTTWAQNIRNHGYTYSTAMGENIAAGNKYAANTFTQWKNSTGHNAAMLNANYKAIGIGRAYGATAIYRWYWTTDFGGTVDGAGVICDTSSTGSSPTPTLTPPAISTAAPSPTTAPSATASPTPSPTKTPSPTATATPPPPTATPSPTATATPPPTSTPPPTATATLPPPTATQAPVAYVAGVTGKEVTKRGSKSLSLEVKIVNSNGASVAGANVSMVLTLPDGSSKMLTGVTSGRGKATWSVPVTATGVYSTNVADVSATSYAYDPGLNAASGVTIAVT